MEIVLYHKFSQHENLKQLLLGTGDAEIIVSRICFLHTLLQTSLHEICPELHHRGVLGHRQEREGQKRGWQSFGASEKDIQACALAR